MTPLWMPPMAHVLDLKDRLGIDDNHEDFNTYSGDIGTLEHVIHELAHAVLLDLVIVLDAGDGDPEVEGLSVAVSMEIAARSLKNRDTAARYEIETIAAEWLVAVRLVLPITQSALLDALAIQVAHELSDYDARFFEQLTCQRPLGAAARVCEIIAPTGRGPFRETALFQRIDRNGREICVYPMLLGNARLCIGDVGSDGYDDAWCYQTDAGGRGAAKAIAGAAQWNGDGDDPPGGWARNPRTGRRRDGGDAGKAGAR